MNRRDWLKGLGLLAAGVALDQAEILERLGWNPSLFTTGGYERSTFSNADFACTRWVTLKSGMWNDPAVWSNGRVPPDNANVLIEHSVTMDNATVRRQKLAFGQDGDWNITSHDTPLTIEYSMIDKAPRTFPSTQSGFTWLRGEAPQSIQDLYGLTVGDRVRKT